MPSWRTVQLSKGNEIERSKADQVLERAIRAAEAAMREFKGTEQQLEAAQVLLVVLQKAERFDRWTEVFLEALYKHPTHPVVARFAHDAVRISELAGQQKQVLDALAYLSDFPAEFAGRGEIEAALSSAEPCFSQAEILRHVAAVGGPEKSELFE